MELTVNLKQAQEFIIDCIGAALVPFITGAPGIGKSSIVKSIADEYNLELIDLRLSQCDPTDLMGLPRFDPVSGKASYAPMATFPLSTDPVPNGKDGWLLFLDEFNSASISVQAAAYKLVLDKKVGQADLNPRVAIVCAGNRMIDNAITNRLSTAMQSRLIHLELNVETKEWLEWAHINDIDYRITSYINHKPEVLNSFNPNHDDKTFPCQRTWEFVARLIKLWKGVFDFSKLPLIAGAIGEGAAREFVSYCQIFKDLPTIQDIISNPIDITLPSEPSTLYALTGSLANYINDTNADRLMLFIERLPREFQFVTMKDVCRRKRDLLKHKSIATWVTLNANELFN